MSAAAPPHSPPTAAAADLLAGARRLVVKVGSSLLAGGDEPAERFAARLAQDVAALRARGASVVLVSSGAVALGRPRLGLPPRRRLSLPEKQAAAAAGQTALMAAWESALAPHGITAAQVLLTRDDTEVRARWLNGRATLATLLRLGALPVVNENDTVAVEELRYGDNDRLAARVAQMVGAEALVLLSDVDGLHTADPRRDPAARHLPLVEALTPEVEAMAGGADAAAGMGTGGMASKLAAARIAREAGCATLIAAGRAGAPDGGPLAALGLGARATVIAAAGSPRAAYKAWIAGRLHVAGTLVVDAGAARALAAGRSLLAAGVVEVRGRFGEGDAVAVEDAAGVELARGLVRFDAATVARIKGQRSDTPDFPGRPELIHKDDLVLPGAP